MNTDIDQLEVLPQKEKMTPAHVWKDHEDLNWNKMRAWFSGQVGKHINQVFSDFCALAWVPEHRKTKKILKHFITVDTFLKNKRVYIIDSFGQEEMLVASWRDVLYVVPSSGLVKKIKKEPYKRIEPPKTLILLGDYHNYEKVNGVWYEFQALPNPNYKGWHSSNLKIYQKYLPFLWSIPIVEETVGPKDSLNCKKNTAKGWFLKCFNIKKRQLSSKELKKLRIKND